MEQQCTADMLTVGNKGPSKNVVQNGYVTFKNAKSNSRNFDKITVSRNSLKFNETNLYEIVIEAFLRGCPYKEFIMEPVFSQESEYLDVEKTVRKDYLAIVGIIPKDTVLKLKTSQDSLVYFDQIEIKGTILISNLRCTAEQIMDRIRNTSVKYISNRPQIASLLPPMPMPAPGVNPLLPQQHPNATDIYPWTLSIIPHKQNQPLPQGSEVIVEPPLVVPPGATNGYNSSYEKFRSIPDSIAFYLGNESTEDKINRSIFAKDYEYRGYANISDKSWENANYLKKQYVSAVSSDKLKFYDQKIKDFANVAYSDVVINRLPFASSFKKNVILFFLEVHIGKDEYPQYVYDYFNGFTNLIGIGNPDVEEYGDILLKGNHNFAKVFSYFEEKLTSILNSGDKTCIAYWFGKSGFPRRTMVAECIHNVVAFSQFANTLYSIVYASIRSTNPISPNLPPYPNFLELFKNASSSEEKLNIIREAYRLTVPNGASFSTSEGDALIQTRHNHLEIMIQNNPGSDAAQKQFSFYTYKPQMYGNFSGNFDDIYDIEVVPDLLDAVKTSPLDQETVVDVNKNIVPIFSRPIYTSFGLGYRRCAGEVFSYLVAQRLLEKFCLAKFEIRDGTYPTVYVAPSKGVPDNIFIVH